MRGIVIFDFLAVNVSVHFFNGGVFFTGCVVWR